MRITTLVGRVEADIDHDLVEKIVELGRGDKPMHARRLADDVAHALSGVERGHRVLKDHLHGQRRGLGVGAFEARSLTTLEAYGALARRQDPGHHPAERGLAAAGFADQAHHLARLDRERHVVDRMHDLIAQVGAERAGDPAGEIEALDEAPADPFEVDDRRRHVMPPGADGGSAPAGLAAGGSPRGQPGSARRRAGSAAGTGSLRAAS